MVMPFKPFLQEVPAGSEGVFRQCEGVGLADAGEAEGKLEEAVKNCITELEKFELVTSVGLPAIGCGCRGFPPAASAGKIFSALQSAKQIKYFEIRFWATSAWEAFCGAAPGGEVSEGEVKAALWDDCELRCFTEGKRIKSYAIKC